MWVGRARVGDTVKRIGVDAGLWHSAAGGTPVQWGLRTALGGLVKMTLRSMGALWLFLRHHRARMTTFVVVECRRWPYLHRREWQILRRHWQEGRLWVASTN